MLVQKLLYRSEDLGLNVSEVVHPVDVDFVDALVDLQRLRVDGLTQHLLLLVKLLLHLEQVFGLEDDFYS